MVFKGAFKEGSSYFLDAYNSEIEVIKSTRPENISCGQLGQGKPIVCSAYNLDVTFNIKHTVGWCAIVNLLGFHIKWTRFLSWPSCGGPI